VLPLPAPGELLLLGASEAFKNEALQETRYRGDRLLGNAAAHLTLPAELAAVLGRRPAPRGLYFTAPQRRLAWRAGVLALPLLALPAGWWLRRRGGPR
jgi:lipopolysaccharide export LptBFGC system permease protein LptF